MSVIHTIEARQAILSTFIEANEFEIMVITNGTLTEATTYADLVEFDGTGYARIDAPSVDWAVANGVAAFAKQSFVAGVGGWEGITGIAVVTKVSPTIFALLEGEVAPYNFPENGVFEVTPVVAINAPAPVV